MLTNNFKQKILKNFELKSSSEQLQVALSFPPSEQFKRKLIIDSFTKLADGTIELKDKFESVICSNPSIGIGFVMLVKGINEAHVAFHLSSRGYFSPSMNHCRSILEICNLIKLFIKYPSEIKLWQSDDWKIKLKEFSPSAVRKKLGEKRIDQIYSFLSELGTHCTWNSTTMRFWYEKPEEKDSVPTLITFTGGTLDKNQIVVSNTFVIYCLSILLLSGIHIYEVEFSPEEGKHFYQLIYNVNKNVTIDYFFDWSKLKNRNILKTKEFIMQLDEALNIKSIEEKIK